MRRDRPGLGPRAPCGLRRRAAGADGRGAAGRCARRVRCRWRTARSAEHGRHARVPAGARARDRGVLQRLRRARRRRDRRLGGDRLQHAARDAAREGLVVPRASDERALRRRRRRLRRGWRRRRRRARGARPKRAAARARPAPDRGRLHALGGEGGARSLVADPVRADRRRRGRRGRADRRPLRRRQHDDQHEGGAARAREGLAKWHEASGLVGSSGTPFGSSDLDPHYDRVEQRLGVRERDRLAEERAHRRARLPRARRASSSRCARTPTRTA